MSERRRKERHLRVAVRAGDREVLEGIDRILASVGHDVREVTAAAASPPNPYDVLVLVCEPDDDLQTIAAVQRSAPARAVLYVVPSGVDPDLLGAGATISLPFSRKELIDRVSSVVNAITGPTGLPLPFELPGIRIDARERITIDGAPVVLTKTEHRLLFALLRAAGEPLTRGELLSSVWNMHPDLDTRTVDTHINRLRLKLGRVGQRIVAIRRGGYMFRMDA